MIQRLILLCAMLASMFALGACGDSDSNENEKICDSLCSNNSCDDIEELRDCEDDCVDFLDDADCGDEARDAFDCIDDDDCDWDGDCAEEFLDWVECAFL